MTENDSNLQVKAEIDRLERKARIKAANDRIAHTINAEHRLEQAQDDESHRQERSMEYQQSLRKYTETRS